MAWRCSLYDRSSVAHLPYATRTRLRGKVAGAIHRCTNESSQRWHRYGGRGIRVHDEWLANPWLFVAYLATLDGHDDPRLWLDRIDNDGHYEPGNLRFATGGASRRNQSRRLARALTG